MEKFETFQAYLADRTVEISSLGFLINLLGGLLLAILLGAIYTRFATVLSDRRGLAGNFALISATTVLIIAIVKSSLALSLGLVGALSIVRFRAAIKEPEELAYLFLAIGIGLGFGAGQRQITLLAFVVICLYIVIRFYFKKDSGSEAVFLSVSGKRRPGLDMSQVVETLSPHCSRLKMRRFHKSDKDLEIIFVVEFKDYVQMQEAHASLRQLDEALTVTFVDGRGSS